MSLKLSIFCLIVGIPFTSKTQKKTQHTNMLWEGYYSTININKKWSLLSDAQIRTRAWTQQWSQILIRTGASYKVNENVSVTSGFAFFKNAQYTNKGLFLKNEWRPWQELFYQVNFNKIYFTQRLRTEQRFLQQVINNKKSKNYQYIFRLRYRFEWQFPLEENKVVFLVGNEILVNPGYINNTLFFDQNRSFAGLNVKLQTCTGLQFQYLKIFQWHSTTSVLENQNVIRVNLFQQLSFRKKPNTKLKPSA